jgi:hypothetical protein
MKLYLSKTHSDEDDDDLVTAGKLVMIYGTKQEVLELCDFFKSVEKHLNQNEFCHMHLRDHLTDWNSKENVDIEINAEK